MPARLSGLAVTSVAAGLVLALSGIKNQTLQATLTALLKGAAPADVAEQAPTLGVAPTGSSGSTGSTGGAGSTDSSLANIALTGIGHQYVYGGACGPDGTRPWDCSSACGWWLHEAGMQLPGGSWESVTGNGSSHGPPTGSYLISSLYTTVGTSPSDAQAGDLCVWQTHMGVALGGGQMVSALNEQLGTQKGSIAADGPKGEILFVKRPR